jgi:hypothetical protein
VCVCVCVWQCVSLVFWSARAVHLLANAEKKGVLLCCQMRGRESALCRVLWCASCLSGAAPRGVANERLSKMRPRGRKGIEEVCVSCVSSRGEKV